MWLIDRQISASSFHPPHPPALLTELMSWDRSQNGQNKKEEWKMVYKALAKHGKPLTPPASSSWILGCSTLHAFFFFALGFLDCTCCNHINLSGSSQSWVVSHIVRISVQSIARSPHMFLWKCIQAHLKWITLFTVMCFLKVKLYNLGNIFLSKKIPRKSII